MATPAVRSATATAIALLPAPPVTGSRNCRGGVLGVGVVDGVGADGLGSGVVDGLGDADGAGVGVTGVGVGTGVADGVVDGLGADVVLGVGVTDGVVDGLGVGLGDADGAGVGVGLGVGVGSGVGTTGLVSNPALPPDSRRMIRAATSQDLSWEVILATSRHGPGSVALTLTLIWKRAFSPLSNLTEIVALSLEQLAISGSMYRVYIG